MLEFRPIASSSAGNAYKLSADGAAPLLLDAGISFARIQEALDFQVSSLAGVLLSHAHGDHSKAVPDLMSRGVNVYASAETWAEMPKASGAFAHRTKTVEAMGDFQVGAWTVKPFDAVHDSPGALGYIVAAPGDQGKLLFLTDTAYSRFRFDGIRIFAVECNFSREILRANTMSGDIDSQRFRRVTSTHMSLERLLTMLKANDLSQCEEIHLLHLSSANSDAVAFKDKVQKATGIPTYIAAEREVAA